MADIMNSVTDIVPLQNENVNREATSVSLLQDVRRPNRRTGHKNLRPKTFQFREAVWSTFFPVELLSIVDKPE